MWRKEVNILRKILHQLALFTKSQSQTEEVGDTCSCFAFPGNWSSPEIKKIMSWTMQNFLNISLELPNHK
jgi:hypothetical protein